MTSGSDPAVDAGLSPEPDSGFDSPSDDSLADDSPSDDSASDSGSGSELGEAAVRQWLVDYLIDIIGIDPDDVDCDAPLSDLAVGSADAVVLAGELGELLGRAVSPVEFWQYPTVNAVARFVTGGEIEPVFDVAAAGNAAATAVTGDHDGEPIAVIGLGCRFPGGVRGPDEFWEFLAQGGSGVGEVPPERWSWYRGESAEEAAALAATTRWGGFLDDLAAFDAEFFEVPPREADKMDPQQRLLLEVTQEALEHAGIPPQSLRHTQTGVFAGACLGEYGSLLAADLAGVDAWSGTGGALSIIANRVSYFFDFRGPSVTVDTACSSSLVAVHLACQSLRSGDSDVALAAGVNVLLSPAPTRSFDSAEVMSTSGRCYAFDGRADGFVRSEGAGVVVLKRLSDAVRDGDRLLAVVRGSAVNQDGRSNGLMAPNPAAQMAVLRAAYVNAGIQAREVDYIEAHGTGTLLGDPIEARALGAVLGRGRPVEAPLLVGSVKSNLGHLESAAGVAGLIKAVLAVHRGEIPANLDYEIPNPHIPFESLRLKVVAEPTEWLTSGRPRRAGVSSFGFGGTNAHVVIEEAPAHVSAPAEVSADPVVTTLVVSGKTPARISALAGMLADWMETAGSDVPLAEVAHTLNHHRGRYAQFATVCGRDRAQVVAGLRALAQGRSAPGVADAHRGTCRPGTVFVYSGQGSQWPGMARRLLADEPVFATAIDELEPCFVEQVGFSLRQILADGEQISGDARVQPVLVGLQLALTALWRSYGVVPDAVIGHSMGEVTAAVVAGALTPAEGLRVIATRSRLMAQLGGRGAVGLVELGGDAAAEAINGYPGVEVAGYLSPRQSVVAGPVEQVESFLTDQSAQDRFARRVNMEVASHTGLMDPVLGELRRELADLTPKTPAIPFISTIIDPAACPKLDADYWADNVRRPVNFTQAVSTAASSYSTFVEISPNPVLTYAVDDTLSGTHHHALPTLTRDTDDTLTFHTQLNATHTAHPPVTPHPPEPHAPLPATPWHPTRHWAITKPRSSSGGSAPRPGTLLGGHIPVGGAMPAHLWQARLVSHAKPYPGCRRIGGVEVVPASIVLRTLSAAATECGASTVDDVRLENPVVLNQPRMVQVFSDGRSVTISSAAVPADDADLQEQHWVRHASARISHQPPAAAPLFDATVTSTDTNAIGHDPSSAVEVFQTWGVEGQAFGWSVDSHESTPGRIRVAAVLPEHPAAALLDAATDLAPLVDGSNSELLVPTSVESVSVTGITPSDGVGVVEVRQRPGNGLVVDVALRTSDGRTMAHLRGLEYSPVAPGTALVGGDPRTIAHVIDWQPRDADGDIRSDRTGVAPLAVIGTSRAAATLRAAFGNLGFPVADVAEARYVLYVADSEDADANGAHTNGAQAGRAHVDVAVRMTSEVGSLVAQLAERDYRNPATLWILTRGVHDAVSDAALRQSCLWGLAGVIGAEQPQLWGGLVDIAAADAIGACAAPLATVLSTPAKATLLLRDGDFLSATLVPISDRPVREALRCRPDAAYLITGGLGELGLLMADWLVDRGARRLVLAGRSALPPRRQWDDESTDTDTRRRIAAVRALEMRGVSVDVVSLDTGSRQALQALCDRRAEDGQPPIVGVIHAAGLTDGQLVTEIEAARVERTVWPKIAGARALDAVFPPGSLDFLFLIASAGAVFGVPGQGAYAVGNAYLDGLARARHRLGCNTVSLDWVAWQGLGFAREAEVVVQELARMGSRPVKPAEAFRAWEYVTRYDLAQVVMAPMRSADEAMPGHAIAKPARDWSLTTPEDLRAELQEGMRSILATELHLPSGEVELDRPFAEMGLNSVMAMSIRRQAEELVGTELSATMLWNHPTIASFAAYLAKQLQPDAYSDDEDDGSDSGSAVSVLDSLFDSIESAPHAW